MTAKSTTGRLEARGRTTTDGAICGCARLSGARSLQDWRQRGDAVNGRMAKVIVDRYRRIGAFPCHYCGSEDVSGFEDRFFLRCLSAILALECQAWAHCAVGLVAGANRAGARTVEAQS